MSQLLPYQEYTSEIKILGSHFIAVLEPILDESEIDAHLERLKSLYPKATHYCYASRFGPNERMSDDGEPSRSAGMPLLTILRQRGITQALVLVIRYFGGTKLGLPRLTRTYRDAAEDVIAKARFATIIDGSTQTLIMSYANYDYVKKLVAKTNLEMYGEVFSEEVTITLKGETESLTKFVSSLPYEICRGDVTPIKLLKEAEQ